MQGERDCHGNDARHARRSRAALVRDLSRLQSPFSCDCSLLSSPLYSSFLPSLSSLFSHETNQKNKQLQGPPPFHVVPFLFCSCVQLKASLHRLGTAHCLTPLYFLVVQKYPTNLKRARSLSAVLGIQRQTVHIDVSKRLRGTSTVLANVTVPRRCIFWQSLFYGYRTRSATVWPTPAVNRSTHPLCRNLFITKELGQFKVTSSNVFLRCVMMACIHRFIRRKHLNLIALRKALFFFEWHTLNSIWSKHIHPRQGRELHCLAAQIFNPKSSCKNVSLLIALNEPAHAGCGRGPKIAWSFQYEYVCALQLAPGACRACPDSCICPGRDSTFPAHA